MGVLKDDLLDLVSKHGERLVVEAVAKDLIEPALDKVAQDLPDPFRVIGASGVGVVKAYLEKALDHLEKKLEDDKSETTETTAS